MSIRMTVALGLLSVGVLWSGLAVSQEIPAGPSIQLDRAVHFLSPDGTDTVLAPGVYGVETKDEKSINLTAVGGGKAITIQAESGTHEEQLSAPHVLTGAQEEDFFQVVLLMPGGKTLEALGTFSGVRTRAPSAMVPLRPLMPRPLYPVSTCMVPTGPGTSHGSVTTAQTWTAADSPHNLPTDINITAQLVIEPCAVVRIGPGRTITIMNAPMNTPPSYGALIASGLPGAPVTIEPLVAGQNWASIRNYNGILSLSHAILRSGGAPAGFNQALTGALRMLSTGAVGMFHVDDVEISLSSSQGVYIDGDIGFDPTSQNLRVLGSAGYPVSVVARVLNSIPAGTYFPNGRNAIAVAGVSVGGSVSNAQTMHYRGVPYHIGRGSEEGRMDVNSGITGMVAVLTIEPGVQIQFPSGGTLNIDPTPGSNYVNPVLARGALIAIGTAAQPITFTSDKGSASAPGDWLGIGFGGEVDSRSILQHVRVLYAGGPTVTGSNSCPFPGRVGPNYAAIRIFGPAKNQFITSTDIMYSALDGIDRGWRANVITDFVSNSVSNTTFNTVTAFAGCKQSTPRDYNGVCPANPPPPCEK